MVVVLLATPLKTWVFARKLDGFGHAIIAEAFDGAIDRGQTEAGYLVLGGGQQLRRAKGVRAGFEHGPDGLALAGIALHKARL
jgi:hypothetical protein